MQFDLSSALANFAVTCAVRAANHRRDAAEARSRLATGGDQYDGGNEREAKRHDLAAAEWDRRAEHARHGLLSVPVDDAGFAIEHQALINEAASAGRVVSVES
jgi:hypothetical protein